VATEGRLRLTLIGGYLGSGKTTWLRHQLHEGRFGRVHVVVNEAAEIPVDDLLLGTGDRVSVIPGGCVCCTARDDLLTLLRGLCDRRTGRDGPDARLDQLVLETSGLADPAGIVAAINGDPVLVHHIVIAETVVIVDALHALQQLRHEPLGRRQIEAADRLVLTKIDQADPAALVGLAATLAALNPGAEVSAAVMGTAVALPPTPQGINPDPLGDLPDADPVPVSPVKLHLGDDVDWTAFSVWLSALLHAHGAQIVRVKGVVRTPRGRLLVQAVRNVVQSPEILPGAPAAFDDTIVLIGRGLDPEALRRSLRTFAGLQVSASQNGERAG
jgi:G3E family GTPase